MPPLLAEIDDNASNATKRSSLTTSTKEETASTKISTASDGLKCDIPKHKDERDENAPTRQRKEKRVNKKKVADLMADINATMSEMQKLNMNLPPKSPAIRTQKKRDKELEHKKALEKAHKERDLALRRLLAEQDELRLRLDMLKESHRSKGSHSSKGSRRSKGSYSLSQGSSGRSGSTSDHSSTISNYLSAISASKQLIQETMEKQTTPARTSTPRRSGTPRSKRSGTPSRGSTPSRNSTPRRKIRFDSSVGSEKRHREKRIGVNTIGDVRTGDTRVSKYIA